MIIILISKCSIFINTSPFSKFFSQHCLFETTLLSNPRLSVISLLFLFPSSSYYLPFLLYIPSIHFPYSFYLSFLNLLLFLSSPFLLFLYNSFDFTTILTSLPFFSHFSLKFILPYPTINIFIINFYFIIHS